MLVIPVEKKGKFADSLSLRFLCYDPATRMAYLSDKGAKVRQWKHRMRVYAIMPKCLQSGEPINFRLWNFEAKELLTFTVTGVASRRFDSSNPADREEMQRLPHLLNVSYQDSEPSIRGGREGVVHTEDAEEPTVTLAEEATFFGKDRDDWTMRCSYYTATHDVIMLIRESLIACGLRFPIYGGLRHAMDPRNDLLLAQFPLYLMHNFRQLAGAIVYCCVHGSMIGCGLSGAMGVCMKHVYLCITDQDVLFVNEGGAVARSVPLSYLTKLEYSGPGVGADGKNGSSSKAASPVSSPSRRSPMAASVVPYMAFLADAEAADVLFSPRSAFPSESEDCSASMTASMPRMNVEKEMANVVHILTTLLRHVRTGGLKHGVQEVNGRDSDYDNDVQLEGDSASADAEALPDSYQPPARPAPLPSTFTVQTLSNEETMYDYAAEFEDRHSRSFKWQPLPGAHRLTPTVQSAASVALSLGMRPPAREPITRRPEFLPFYYGSSAAARAAAEQATAVHASRREHSPPSFHTPGEVRPEDGIYTDAMFAPTVPVRRVSKIIDMFKPDPDIY